MRNTGVYKFRVTFQSQQTGKDGPVLHEQLYRTYARAKKFYKNHLLNFHKDRTICEWRICLNRPKEERWKNPLHEDFSDRVAMVG